MIVVTGADGRLGRAVVEQLLEPRARRAGRSERPRSAEGPGPRAAGRAGPPRGLHRPGEPGSAFRGASRLLVMPGHHRGGGRATPPRGDRCGRRRPASSGSSTPAHGRRSDLALRAHARPRRHRGDPPRQRRRVHLAAQRLLRLDRPAAAGGRIADRRARAPRTGPWRGRLTPISRPSAVLALTGDVFRRQHPAADQAPRASVLTRLVAALASALVGRAIGAGGRPRRAVLRAVLLEQGVSEHAADLRVGLFAASRRGDLRAERTRHSPASSTARPPRSPRSWTRR